MGFNVNTVIVVSCFNRCYLTNGTAGSVFLGNNSSPATPHSSMCSIYIGLNAGIGHGVSACRNIHIGVDSGAATGNTTSRDNVGLGFQTIYYVNGGCNVAIGYCAMLGGPSGATGACNVAIGYASMQNLTSGIGNTVVGMFAGCNITSGSCNVAIGYSAGCCLATGSGNVMIGSNVFGAGLAGASNCVCIAAGKAAPPFISANSTGVGFCTSSPAARVHVTGGMFATSEITAYYSDRRLKENIEPISNALQKISTISGVCYTPNKKAIGFGFEENKRHVGVLADEVEKVLPEVIVPAPFDTATDRESITGEYYKTVKYERIVPLLVAGIKELKIKADSLQTKLHDLKKQNS